MPRQLPLELRISSFATLNNFVVGNNDELLARLNSLYSIVEKKSVSAIQTERIFYIWGAVSSGRTHLLHALCNTLGKEKTLYLNAKSALTDFVFNANIVLYTLDDCEQLSPEAQIAAFTLFNEIRASRANNAFIIAGNAPPIALALRDDLRTRLSWGLVYRLIELSDEDKMVALSIAAKERGLPLTKEILIYLLNHFERDMQSLMNLIDALDHFSLERKRAITLPLLRTMLTENNTLRNGE